MMFASTGAEVRGRAAEMASIITDHNFHHGVES